MRSALAVLFYLFLMARLARVQAVRYVQYMYYGSYDFNSALRYVLLLFSTVGFSFFMRCQLVVYSLSAVTPVKYNLKPSEEVKRSYCGNGKIVLHSQQIPNIRLKSSTLLKDRFIAQLFQAGFT